MSDQELLNTEEVAAMARTTTGNIHYLRSVGKGPRAVKFGRRLLFKRADVEQWLDNLPTATTASDRPA